MSSPVKISVLWDEVVKVAAESPDFVHTKTTPDMCMYQLHGRPSCLVGHALFGMGVPLSDLRRFDDCVAPAISTLPDEFPDMFEVDSPEALDRLGAAQEAQDSGRSWGDAVGNPGAAL